MVDLIAPKHLFVVLLIVLLVVVVVRLKRTLRRGSDD
jgi:hypothetical protein